MNTASRQKRIEAIREQLVEASYEGNIGAMEVMEFYQTASDEDIAAFEQVMNSGDESAAWDIIQSYTNTDLVGIGTENPVQEMLQGLVREELQNIKKREYINDYFDRKRRLTSHDLTTMIREALSESPESFDVQAASASVLEQIRAGLSEMGLPDIDESSIIIKDRHVRIMVPTSGGRAALAEYIKQALSEYEGEYTLHSLSSRGQVIGYTVKSGRSVVARFDMKPSRGSGVQNKGDVAEGILGAAVAASFMNGSQEISSSDVESLLEALNSEPDQSKGEKTTAKAVTKKIEREDGTVDEITLDVRLAKRNFDDLMDSSKRGELTSLFRSAVGYANSDEVLTASQSIVVDNNPTKIRVLSDGVGDQKGTKVDVRIFMDGVEMDIGRISLKAGATNQLGQIGKSWEAMAGDKGMFKVMFGVQPDPSLEEKWNEVTTNPKLRSTDNIKKVGFEVYADAHRKIKSLLSGDVVDEEMDFLKRLATGVRYQAVLEEKGVRLIQLNKGDFKVLDFSKLEEALTEVDFDAILQKESSKGGISPKIIIVDKKTGGQLVSMRVKVEGGGKTIRHYIEKGPLLVQLLSAKRKLKAPEFGDYRGKVGGFKGKISKSVKTKN